MGHVEDLKARHTRALEISSELKPKSLYLPISGALAVKDGASLRVGVISTGEPVFIRPVELNPLGTEAYGAAKEAYLVPYVLKHHGLVHSELVIEDITLERLSDDVLDQLRPITFCLSLCVGAPISIPFLLRTSWSSLPAFNNQSVEIHLTSHGYTDSVSFTGGEVDTKIAEFVDCKLPSLRSLLKNKAFQIAVEAYEACLKVSNKKIAIATAWTGIEALFGISSELRFRIALYVATELSHVDEPYDVFQQTLSLYDARSKVVHGATIDSTKLNDAYGRSLGLLMTLLRVIVERGSLRTTKEIEQSLFKRK